MKIERKEVGFAPIILTIESQMELDVLSELASLGIDTPGVPEKVNQFVKQLTEGLVNSGASADFQYFCDFDSNVVAKY